MPLEHLARRLKFRFVITALAALSLSPVQAEEFQSPDIVVLGDSQISFGSGPVFVDFFQNIEHHCQDIWDEDVPHETLGAKTVAAIGVRSTSLRSWVTRRGGAKGAVCDVDPKWNANAGTFGVINQSKHKYVQIGRGKNYQFCKRGQSPFEAMFTEGYYAPKLLIMNFLGNSARTWAKNKEQALRDVEDTMAQLPADMACIFMTTAPSYKQKSVDLRLKAQENLKNAFAESGSRCSFVEGFTPETIAANQGNRLFFRRSASGRVKDPFHPNEKAQENFFMVRKRDICQAVQVQLQPNSTETASLADRR